MTAGYYYQDIHYHIWNIRGMPNIHDSCMIISLMIGGKTDKLVPLFYVYPDKCSSHVETILIIMRHLMSCSSIYMISPTTILRLCIT